MEKILITGATGFLGSYLCKKFYQEGYSIAMIKRPSSNTWRIDPIIQFLEVYTQGDLTVSEIIAQVKPQHIIHTACDYGRKGSSLRTLIQTNITFGIDVLEAAIEFQAETFINTDSLLPANINDYSLSKHQFRQWLESKSDRIDIINLKIEHMYGPLDDDNKFVYWLINQIKNKEVNAIPLTSGIQERDFIYIDDVVNAFDITLKNKVKGYQSFDVGTGKFIKVKTFIKELVSQINIQEGQDVSGKLQFGQLAYRKNEVMSPDLDNQSLKNLGWRSKMNYREGIKEILKK